MSKVFVGGSRKVSRLTPEVRSRLDRIIEKNLPVVVGDANGADKAVQQYFQANQYHAVEVFCTGNECRNNLGRWPVRHIAAEGRKKDLDFYTAKDRAMTHEATFGLMIWDGQSMGTLMNVSRLIAQRKKVAVYDMSSKKFVDLKDESDWEQFISNRATELKRRVHERAEVEKRSSGIRTEPELV